MTEFRSDRGRLAIAVFALALSGCASKVLKIENSDEILATKEYEQVIEVKALEPEGPVPDESSSYVMREVPPYVPPPSTQMATGVADSKTSTISDSKSKAAEKESTKGGVPSTSKAGGKASSKTPPAASLPMGPPLPPRPSGGRQPEIEDAAGFEGRRPSVDPFRVGEVVTLEASYFGVVAGDITLEVRPFRVVNGRKSYYFAGTAKSTSVFAVFYALDDLVETFVDYDDLIPYNYALHVKETKQLREVRSFFDWKKLYGYVWDRKVTKEKGVEEKKYEWDILPYSQNVFSAPFYMRTFQLEPGKKIQYRVGHEGKNLVVTGEVLRREVLSTPLGDLNTLVMKPSIEIDGVFKPVGEVLFWLTDDDRKFIVRIEAKIKIGKVVAMVKSIEKGRP